MHSRATAARPSRIAPTALPPFALLLVALFVLAGCTHWEGPNVTLTDRAPADAPADAHANTRANPVDNPTTYKSNVPIGAAATFARAWDLHQQADSQLFRLDRAWLAEDAMAFDDAGEHAVPPPTQRDSRAEVRATFERALSLYDKLAGLPRADRADTGTNQVAPSDLDAYRALCLMRLDRRADAVTLLRADIAERGMPDAWTGAPSPRQWLVWLLWHDLRGPDGAAILYARPLERWLAAWRQTGWPSSVALRVTHTLMGNDPPGFGISLRQLVSARRVDAEATHATTWFDAMGDWPGEGTASATDTRALVWRIWDRGPHAVAFAPLGLDAPHPLLAAEAHMALAARAAPRAAGAAAWHLQRAVVEYERATAALAGNPDAATECRTRAATAATRLTEFADIGVTPERPAAPGVHPLLREHNGDG